MRHNWYRNETWNDEIQEAFEARLKRSRGTFNKAQYLKIQAFILLDTSDASYQNTGILLLQQLFQEFPMEKSEVIHAHRTLVLYYRRTGNLTEARNHYDMATNLKRK